MRKSQISTGIDKGYERLAELAEALPSMRLVCVGDRESDMLTLLLKARELGHTVDYLLRCQHNRVLPAGGKLWETVMDNEPLGRICFDMPAGRSAHESPRVLRRLKSLRGRLRFLSDRKIHG